LWNCNKKRRSLSHEPLKEKSTGSTREGRETKGQGTTLDRGALFWGRVRGGTSELDETGYEKSEEGAPDQKV